MPQSAASVAGSAAASAPLAVIASIAIRMPVGQGIRAGSAARKARMRGFFSFACARPSPSAKRKES
jgi:hypothetical protein